MKLSFFPGNLHLRQDPDGQYVVEIAGNEILRTKARKVAVKTFNEFRTKMEREFPTCEFTPEEKAEMYKRAIGDALVGHNSLGGRKKKTSARGTRTFGG